MPVVIKPQPKPSGKNNGSTKPPRPLSTIIKKG